MSNTSLTQVGPRNGPCLAAIAKHATAWQFNAPDHETLREQVVGFVAKGLYHGVQPSLQTELVDVVASIWEPGMGTNAFKVAYVPLGSDEMIVIATADFLAKFEWHPIQEPSVDAQHEATTLVPILH